MDDLTIGGVTFGEPWFLALLAAAPLLLLIVALGAWNRRRAARRFGVLSSVRNGRRFLASLVVILAVAGMALAAALPQWGERPSTIRREGIDLAVAIDVSLSMLSRDVEPSRLDRAKDEVDKLFASLRGDRVALITFAGDATVRFPLTTDIDAARQIVRGITVEYESRLPGSNPAAAINAARSAFHEERSTAKALIIITDGEEVTAPGALGADAGVALDRAREENVRIIVIGVGTEQGGTIPVRNRFTDQVTERIDPITNRPAITKLDEHSLRILADRGKGDYVRLDPSRGLGSVTDRLSQLKASAIFEDTDSTRVERLRWFAGAAFVLLALPLLLARLFLHSSARRRTALASALAATITIVACSEDAALRLNREGNAIFGNGDYAGALEKYRKAQVERPDLAEFNYNAANSLFRMNDLERAIEEAQRALNSNDAVLLARVYYSLGNYYASLDRWQEARAAFRNSLVQNPNDADAKYNLEVANRKLALSTPPPDSPTSQLSPSPSARAAPPPGGEGGGDGQPSPSATSSGTLGGGGRPTGTSTPGPSRREDPTQISPEEAAAIRSALDKLDQNRPYDIEEALLILEQLRKAREGRSAQLPVVPAESRRDW